MRAITRDSDQAGRGIVGVVSRHQHHTGNNPENKCRRHFVEWKEEARNRRSYRGEKEPFRSTGKELTRDEAEDREQTDEDRNETEGGMEDRVGAQDHDESFTR